VRSHCKAFTLPQRLSLVAFAIRICSRRTDFSMFCQSMASHVKSVEDAPISDDAAVSFAFPHFNGSPDYLANKDQSDVGPLSCRVTFKPVSVRLQHGIRFFRHPKPAPPSVCLAAHLPSNIKGQYGVSTFRFQKYMGLGACYRPGMYRPRGVRLNPTSNPLCLLAQAYQPLWLAFIYDLYRRFTCVHHIHYLAITRFVVTRG